MPNEMTKAPPSEISAEEYQGLIDKLNQEDERVAYNPLKLIVTLKDTHYYVKQQGADDPIAEYKALDCHVVLSKIARVLYLSREQKMPTCVSTDAGIHGTVSPDLANTVDIETGQLCSACPFNQWGSGFDEAGNPSRGKRCKERRNLLVLHEAYNRPLVLSLAPTSIGAWDAYADGFATQRPASNFIEHMTRAYIETSKEEGREWGIAKFESLGQLKQSDVLAALQIRREYADWLGRVVVENEAREVNNKQEEAPATEDMPF